jgi:hypothetical protein
MSIKISTQADVSDFLKHFKVKAGIWGLIFLDHRHKNFQFLLDTEMKLSTRESLIMGLQLQNYYRGPISTNGDWPADLWEFGIKARGVEVYIKLCLGRADAPALCLSFHEADFPISYPYQ